MDEPDRTAGADSGEADDARVLDEIREALRTNTVLVDATESRRIVESMGAGSRILDALNESDDRLSADQSRARLLRRTQRTLLGCTGLGLGLVGQMIERLGVGQPEIPVPGRLLLVMSAMTLTLLLYNRAAGDRRTFQLDNAMLWIGFTAGWSTFLTGGAGNAIVGLAGWSVSSLLGVIASKRDALRVSAVAQGGASADDDRER